MRRMLTGLAALGLVLSMAAIIAAGPRQDAPKQAVAAKLEATAPGGQVVPITHDVMEGYPQDLQASIEARDHAIATASGTIDDQAPEAVIELTKRWPQKSTVRVAFLDGDATLHKRVVDAAAPWQQVVNLKLDFGLNPATNQYRRWTTSDQVHKAEIRVSFDQGGYWSLVGTDSKSPILGAAAGTTGGRANQRSMNFGGFKNGLPPGFEGTVLHEFGHALGFQHEHQHPTQGCNLDFRFEDDPGYVPTRDQFGQFVIDAAGRRPGIYTTLGGPPNNWPRSQVDFNLRQLPPSHAFQLSPFDRKSIMKYFFPAWMFRTGAASHCFSAGQNLVLSDADKQGARNAYPPSTPPSTPGGLEANFPGARTAEQIEQRRRAAVAGLVNIPGLAPEARSYYESLRNPQHPE